MLIREDVRRRQAYGPRFLRDIVCRRTESGRAVVIGVRHDWVLRSPTGFEWGYRGAGPSDLALNILLYATGDREFAGKHSERFRDEVVGADCAPGWWAARGRGPWLGRTVPRRRPGQGGCVAARGRRRGMNRSPVSRQAVVTHNCGERGKASLALRARRGNGRFVRGPDSAEYRDSQPTQRTRHSLQPAPRPGLCGSVGSQPRPRDRRRPETTPTRRSPVSTRGTPTSARPGPRPPAAALDVCGPVRTRRPARSAPPPARRARQARNPPSQPFAVPPPFSASNSRRTSSSEMSADQPYAAATAASRASCASASHCGRAL